MKIIPLFFIFLFFGGTLIAQNKQGETKDDGRIALTALIPSQVEGLSASASGTLLNKLNQITSKHGLGGSNVLNSQFVITANIVVLTKDITPTAPPMQAFTLEVTFYIGDGLDGTLFSSVSQTVKGVGETETKAYMNALRNISPDNPKFVSFIEQGKNKIIQYYNSKCDFILKEAMMLSNQNEFDAAIFKLMGVPNVCKECFDKCMEAVKPIFQKKIDLECKRQMNEATAIWSSTQDIEGGKKASSILSKINPNSSCAIDAENFIAKIYDDIKKRTKELDAREWEFVLRNQEQESERIQAIRDIGVAYGNNQPKQIQYNVTGWW